MPPADATFHRPSQPAYAVQIVQNADVSNPTAPSCRAYHVEHGSILGSRSAGMPLPRTQIHAIKRIGIICRQFLSVEHRASWVVIEEDSFAEFSCLIQCVLLFGFVFVLKKNSLFPTRYKPTYEPDKQKPKRRKKPSYTGNNSSGTVTRGNRSSSNPSEYSTSAEPTPRFRKALETYKVQIFRSDGFLLRTQNPANSPSI